VTILERLIELGASGERAVLFTVLDGHRAGAKLLALESGEMFGEAPAELAAHTRELLRRSRNRVLELAEGRVFCEVYGPPPRLAVYGAVDTAESLCRAARLLGWTTIVADARAKFATAVVVLTHDDKFDVPALKAALASEAFYIGALGSRRNQERRRERLLEAGIEEGALSRIAGPCGLDIGADSNEETAVSILAEALAARAGREGGPLRTAKQRIHVEVE